MTTPILGLTELVDGQASQGATANQMFRELEGKLVRITSRTLGTQPAVVDGAAYLIPSGATGSGWSINIGKIAIVFGGAFNYFTPAEGWRVWVNDEDLLIRYDGSAWDIIAGLPRMPTVAQSSSTLSITAAHRGRVILCNTASNSITLNLLAAATAGDGFVFEVKKISASNTLTIDPNSTETIDGTTTLALTDLNDSRILVCSGSAWYSVGGGGAGGGSAPFSDGGPLVKNASDNTKTVTISAAGISPSTNRTMTAQNSDGVIAYLTDVAAGGNGDAALGENSASHSGLNYAYYAGNIRRDNVIQVVSGGTTALADNTTNYVECSRSGTVTDNTTGFTVGSFPMAQVVTLAGIITLVTDRRSWIEFWGGKQSMWIPAGAMRAAITNGAQFVTLDMGTDKPVVDTLAFDPTTKEYAHFSVSMPKSWDEGTVSFVPIWSHPATTTNFGVVWSLQGLAISDDDTLNASMGTAQNSTDTGGTTDDQYRGPESSAITIAGTPAENDTVYFRVAREVADGSDTMAVDARLHGILLFYIDTHYTDA